MCIRLLAQIQIASPPKMSYFPIRVTHLLSTHYSKVLHSYPNTWSARAWDNIYINNRLGGHHTLTLRCPPTIRRRLLVCVGGWGCMRDEAHRVGRDLMLHVWC